MVPVQPAVPAANLIAENYQDIDGVFVPMEFIDPISLNVMLDPIIVQPSGNSYDKLTMEEYKRNAGLLKDPIHKTDIHGFGVPNRALKEAIDRFLKPHPELRAKIENEWNERRLVIADLDNRIVTYTSREFSNLFIENNEMIFPAGKDIRITHIDPFLVYKYVIENERGSPNWQYYVYRIFDEAMLLVGKRCTSFTSSSPIHFNVLEDHRRAHTFLSMTSENPIKMSMVVDELHTTATAFFTKMHEEQITTVNILPDQPITFHKISKKVLNCIVDAGDEVSHKVAAFLNIYCPKEYQEVEITASGDLTTISDIEDRTLTLVGDEGFRFTFIPKQ